jgi:hypothetical protein
MLKDKLVNFEKRSMMAKVLTEIQLFQQMPYCFRPVIDIQKYLNNAKVLNESDAYRVSLQNEPRE